MSYDVSYTDLTGIKIRAIAASDKEESRYALYGDNRLFIANTAAKTLKKLARLNNIQTISCGLGDGRSEGKELEISIAYCHPYICVSERFGVNAALYSLTTGNVRELRREDYHCDVSSYSVGFADLNGRIALICQTEWNRLDIFDAETGVNLTEREVYCRKTDKTEKDGNPVYEYKNYLDYFHSRLHVSPDGKHFLSNGWVWSPFDQILLFDTSEFLRTFELGYVSTDCGSGYNWDRPCTFTDNDTFVIALDDMKKTGNLDEEDSENYEYAQLAFFKTNAEVHVSEYKHRWIEPFRKIRCGVFTPNSGEVTGMLFYDKSAGYLTALTPDRGAFAVSLDGDILDNLPDVTASNSGVFNNGNSEIGWNYSTEYHVFYTWQEKNGIVEKKFKK